MSETRRMQKVIELEVTDLQHILNEFLLRRFKIFIKNPYNPYEWIVAKNNSDLMQFLEKKHTIFVE